VGEFQVRRSVFEHNLRDGIDTTGDFEDSVVEDSVFRHLFAGLDLKAIYEQEGDFDVGVSNVGIRIHGSEFVDTNSGVVVTTLDRVGTITDRNAARYLPNDLMVTDAVFDTTGDSSKKAFLIKDAYNVRWDRVSLPGRTNEARIFDTAVEGEFGSRSLIERTN